MIDVGGERFNGCTALDLAAIFFDACEKCAVKNAARKRERMKGQRGGDGAVAGREAKIADDVSTKLEGVNAGLVEIIDGFTAEEFAADFVVQAGFLFNEHHVATRGGEAEGDHRASGAPAKHKVVDVENGRVHGVFLRLTQRRAGKDGWMETSSGCRPASAQISCQSLGMNERA